MRLWAGHALGHRLPRLWGQSWPQLCLGGNKIRKEKLSGEREERGSRTVQTPSFC